MGNNKIAYRIKIMNEFKKEIKNTLEKLNDKIIDKLSLQKEEDKNITIKDVDLLLGIANMINQIIRIIGEK